MADLPLLRFDEWRRWWHRDALHRSPSIEEVLEYQEYLTRESGAHPQ